MPEITRINNHEVQIKIDPAFRNDKRVINYLNDLVAMTQTMFELSEENAGLRAEVKRLSAMVLPDFMYRMDWELLRKQKLIFLKNSGVGLDDFNEALDGLINLIDAIQDTAVDAGLATKEEVFGPLTEE